MRKRSKINEQRREERRRRIMARKEARLQLARTLGPLGSGILVAVYAAMYAGRISEQIAMSGMGVGALCVFASVVLTYLAHRSEK